jgi:hypothetical protein
MHYRKARTPASERPRAVSMEGLDLHTIRSRAGRLAYSEEHRRYAAATGIRSSLPATSDVAARPGCVSVNRERAKIDGDFGGSVSKRSHRRTHLRPPPLCLARPPSALTAGFEPCVTTITPSLTSFLLPASYENVYGLSLEHRLVRAILGSYARL